MTAAPVSDARQREVALWIALLAIAVDGAAAPSAAGAVAAAQVAMHFDDALRVCAAIGFDVSYELALLASLWLLINHGKRGYFRGSLMGYATACLLCAVAPAPEIFVIARTLQGACLGGVFASALFTMVGVSEPRRLIGVFACFTLVALAAPTLGPLFSGALSAALGWRAVFVALAIVPLVAGILAGAVLRDVDAKQPQLFDTASFAAIGIALLALHRLLDGLTPASPDFLCVAVGGAAAAVWFVAREIVSARSPFVDYSPLRNAFVSAALLSSLLVGLLLGATSAIVPFAQAAYGNAETGVQLAALRFIGEVPGAFAVYLMWRRAIVDNRTATLLGLFAVATTFVMQAVAIGGGVAAQAVVAVAQGFALAFMLGPLASLTFNAAPRSQFGALALLFKIVLVLGSALFVPLAGAVRGLVPAAAVYPTIWFGAAVASLLAGFVIVAAPKPLASASSASA